VFGGPYIKNLAGITEYIIGTLLVDVVIGSFMDHYQNTKMEFYKTSVCKLEIVSIIFTFQLVRLFRIRIRQLVTQTNN